MDGGTLFAFERVCIKILEIHKLAERMTLVTKRGGNTS